MCPGAWGHPVKSGEDRSKSRYRGELEVKNERQENKRGCCGFGCRVTVLDRAEKIINLAVNYLEMNQQFCELIKGEHGGSLCVMSQLVKTVLCQWLWMELSRVRERSPDDVILMFTRLSQLGYET